jgi:hypothetical protein
MDLFLLDPVRAEDPVEIAANPAADFVESFGSAFAAARDAGRTTSRHELLMDAYRPIVERLNGGTLNGPWRSPYGYADTGLWMDAEQRRIAEAKLWAEVDRRRAASPRAWAGLPRDAQALEEQVSETVRQVVANDAEVAERRTWTGFAGSLAGGMAGGFDDPVNILATLFSLGAAPHMSVLATAATEGAVNAGVTAATRPQIAQDLNTAGIDYTIEQGLADTALAFGAGAIIGGGVGAGLKVAGADIPWTGAAKRKAIAEFDARTPTPTAEQKTARDALEHMAIAQESHAGPDTEAALDAHIARLDALARGGRSDTPGDLNAAAGQISPLAVEMRIGPAATAQPQALGIEDVDPLGLTVDAARMQFKGGGDARGVTERLKGITQWDPIKSGVAIVWENADGQRFIVDGHQRVGLAKRIAEEDPSQSPRMAARVLREGDGVTAEDAMVVAALKNIAEGTGTTIDAAKVFRLDPARMTDPSLPRASALIRNGKALAQLEPHAWGMVVNELVSPEHAASVARAVPDDPQLQRAIMGLIHKLDPSSQTEADAIIAQAIAAGATREVQGSLFGDEIVASSLYEERAKVLAKAIQTLRRDQKIFGALIRDGSTIEAAGNTLNQATNAELAALAERGLTTLIAAANRKGALSDALTEAAKSARARGRYDDAVKGFVANVRDAAQRGDLTGDRIGAVGYGPDLAAQSGGGGGGEPTPLRPGDDAGRGGRSDPLTDFATPGGKAQEAQAAFVERDLLALQAERTGAGLQLVMPGAEALTPDQLAQAAMDRPITPPASQRGVDGLSLFDPTARDTTGDLFGGDVFAPLEVREVDGETVVMGKSLTDMEADARADQMFLDHLKTCGG